MRGRTTAIVPPKVRGGLCGFLIVTGVLSTVARGASGSAGQFSAKVDTVEVYASVSGGGGVPIKGLRADEFEVFEDGAPQRVSVFTAGNLPLSVAIAVDRSFSMTPPRLAASLAAARHFVRGLRAEDRVMVMAIGSEVELLAALSANHEAALDALSRIERWGTTPLFDATASAIDAIQSASGRRALILLSDGNDSDSRLSAPELLDHARRKDVLVYPVTLGNSRAGTFVELASVTGGRAATVTDTAKLEPTLQAIADDLRNQYLLGYSPSRGPAASPEWRSIQVAVKRPDARVRARDGYISH